jgi:NADH:ubiquinone oxidoreductase subunit 6 (subunit J)
MWQRIQSAYLILFAVIFLGWVAFDVPIGKLDEFDENTQAAAASTALSDGVYQANDYSLLAILSLMGSILAISAVFLYKNRPFQSKMTSVLIFVGIISSIVAFYFLYRDIQTVKVLSSSPFSPSFGAFVPFLGIILALLAKKAIDKDEKIVRSMDRLR